MHRKKKKKLLLRKFDIIYVSNNWNTSSIRFLQDATKVVNGRFLQPNLMFPKQQWFKNATLIAVYVTNQDREDA